jgi:hypothetical protein
VPLARVKALVANEACGVSPFFDFAPASESEGECARE